MLSHFQHSLSILLGWCFRARVAGTFQKRWSCSLGCGGTFVLHGSFPICFVEFKDVRIVAESFECWKRVVRLPMLRVAVCLLCMFFQQGNGSEEDGADVR